jgi:hypothetical protein
MQRAYRTLVQREGAADAPGVDYDQWMRLVYRVR